MLIIIFTLVPVSTVTLIIQFMMDFKLPPLWNVMHSCFPYPISVSFKSQYVTKGLSIFSSSPDCYICNNMEVKDATLT